MYYLIVDVEATCWEHEKKEMEVIEIGTTIVNDTYKEEYYLDIFIKPTINPILSDFCKQLTHIEQICIDNQETFDIVFPFWIKMLKEHGYDVNELIFCSWGNFDWKILNQECTRHNIEFPFKERKNLKSDFAAARGIKKVGMDKALEMLNIPLHGHHHRGIYDSMNITKIFIKENSTVNKHNFREITTLGDIKRLAKEYNLSDDTVIGIMSFRADGSEKFSMIDERSFEILIVKKDTNEFIAHPEHAVGRGPIPEDLTLALAIWSE